VINEIFDCSQTALLPFPAILTMLGVVDNDHAVSHELSAF